MNKEINNLIEDILNEAKLQYDRSKKVYDEAFKKGLPLWEKES